MPEHARSSLKGVFKGGDPNVDLRNEQMPGDEPIDTLDMEKAGGDTASALMDQFMARMAAGWSYWEDNFDFARDDVKFAYERQWEEADVAARVNRPSLTVNLVAQYINHVKGLARQTKFSVHIKQKGGARTTSPIASDPSQSLSLPEIMSGVVRDIEQRSRASREYARAGQHAAEGGFGWLMVRIVKPEDDPRHLELRVEHIADRWSVLFDPFAERPLLEDARWAAITRRIPKKEFDARYPDATPQVGGLLENYSDDFKSWWGSESDVRVSDYYYKQPMERRVIGLMNNTTREDVWGYYDDLEDYVQELQDMGYEVISDEKEMVDQLMVLRCTDKTILESPKKFPCTIIPIVPVFGRQVDYEGKRNYISVTRYAQDPQRMYNAWASAATERVANSPKSPFLIGASQVAGYEDYWTSEAAGNHFALVYNDEDPARRAPERQPAADMPTAELHMMDVGRQAVMEVTGIHEAQQGIKSNEVSGVAIRDRQRAGNVGTHEFLDNLSDAVSNVGDILCQMIPQIYSDDRLQTIIMPDETQAQVHLNHEIRTVIKGRDGQPEEKMFRIGALKLGRYYCHSQAGPAVDTEREIMLEMLLEWGKNNPELFSLTYDVIFANMDAPGAKALAARFKKLVPRHLLSESEQATMPPEQPNPEQQAKMAESEAKSAKAQADIQISQIDLQIAQLKLELEKAKAQLEGAKAMTAGAKDAAATRSQDKGENEIRKVVRMENAKQNSAARRKGNNKG